MKHASATSVSKLLINWREGDPEALGALMPLLYRELRRLAHSHLQRQRHDHTLQSTALVHEAYLKLMKLEDMDWQNRAHFFGVAAHVMRGILVDYARNRDAAKRGGRGYKLSLDEALLGKPQERELNLVALDHALQDLAQIDVRQSRIVELRFFGGLSIEETSEVSVSRPRPRKGNGAAARTWLYRQMRGGVRMTPEEWGRFKETFYAALELDPRGSVLRTWTMCAGTILSCVGSWSRSLRPTSN